MKINCPHCDFRCDNYHDFLYDNDLYQEIEKMVECPNCKDKFAVGAWITYVYEVAEKLEDL